MQGRRTWTEMSDLERSSLYINLIPTAYRVLIVPKLVFLHITKKEYCNIAELMEKAHKFKRNSTGTPEYLLTHPTQPVLRSKSLINKSEPRVI